MWQIRSRSSLSTSKVNGSNVHPRFRTRLTPSVRGEPLHGRHTVIFVTALSWPVVFVRSPLRLYGHHHSSSLNVAVPTFHFSLSSSAHLRQYHSSTLIMARAALRNQNKRQRLKVRAITLLIQLATSGDYLGSGSWLAWANDTAAYYATIHCPH